MEKMLQEFIQFCFEHGSFLRNHKEFGAMSQQLLAEAIKHDMGARENALAKTVISSTYAPELLVAVAPEMNYNIIQKFAPSEITPVFVLVYRFDGKVSEKEYAYVFAGGRVK